VGVESQTRIEMKIIRYPQYRPVTDATCLTIGNFDGVHLGHQALIKQVCQQAKSRQLASCVVTMKPLPAQFFGGAQAVDILTGIKQKASLIKLLAPDYLCALNFNAGLANMSAEDFFQRILKQGLQARYILVGDDFRFGKDRQGGIDELCVWGRQNGIDVEQLNPVEVGGVRASSSHIRQLLRDGDFSQAKLMLGRDFGVTGRVAAGRKMGRQLGFPTLNIELRNGGFPLHGTYVTRVRIKGRWYQSVTSVGFNPTVGGNARRAEVHVFDFSADVYAQTVEVLFYHKLRNEVEFDSLDDLITAIKNDVRGGQDYFASEKGELE
jgi:riboflavin kinase/FMN adenylyltransferase